MKTSQIKERIKKMEAQLTALYQAEDKQVGKIVRQWHESGAKPEVWVEIKNKVIAVYHSENYANQPAIKKG